MKLYRKLQRQGSKEPLPCHFNTVVATIERVLGPGDPSSVPLGMADLYAEKYLRYNLRRKEATPYHGVVDPAARSAATLKGWLGRETLNRIINANWTFGFDPATGEFKSDLLSDRILYDARGIIAEILGNAPCIDSIVNRCDFGNGASATLPRKLATRQRKFEFGMTATCRFLRFAESLVERSPIWADIHNVKSDVLFVDSSGKVVLPPHTVKTVLGSVLDFVPKTKDTDRIIMKEPELNGFFQKGIGSEIRGLLGRYRRYAPEGVLLNVSGDLNQGLAKAGSLDGHIATVDAERASDSISLALCELLLPEKWMELLMVARSPFTVLPDGTVHRLQMMAGMGCGFTFELESVIFYAIGIACAKRSKYPFAEQYVSVHGDDLTIPADVFWLCRQAFGRAGIAVNKSKSFAEGPFRESCGGHYYNGQSVKPFYIKKATGTTRGDWFWLANSLFLWLIDRSDAYLRTPKGKDLTQILLYLRDYAGRGYPTSYCRSRRSGLYSRPPSSAGWSYKVRNIVDIARKTKSTDAQAYAAWLCSPQVSDVQDVIFDRDSAVDPYAVSDTTDERTRTVRLTRWVDVCEYHGRPSLWVDLGIYKA